MSPPTTALPAASFEERTRDLQRRIRAGIDMYTRTLDKVSVADVSNRRPAPLSPVTHCSDRQHEPVPPPVTWCVCMK